MQTIARANRVYADKVSGLIVDYVGVFRNLERALAIYGAGETGGGERPVEDKDVLVLALRKAIEETKALCQKHGVALQPIVETQDFERVRLLDDTANALVASEEDKKRFLDDANNVERLYKAVLPDPKALASKPDCILLKVLADKIRALSPLVDISEIMNSVESLLDRSIAAEGYIIRGPATSDGGDHLIDLSEIDFEALKKKFERGRKHTEAERLKGAVARQLQRMVRLNRTRMDYMERFQKMIDEYNSGSVNIEEFFRRLMEFANNLTQEDQRAVGENLTEEELAIFDLLTKPAMKLTKK